MSPEWMKRNYPALNLFFLWKSLEWTIRTPLKIWFFIFCDLSRYLVNIVEWFPLNSFKFGINGHLNCNIYWIQRTIANLLKPVRNFASTPKNRASLWNIMSFISWVALCQFLPLSVFNWERYLFESIVRIWE